jgi:hypothetical protein
VLFVTPPARLLAPVRGPYSRDLNRGTHCHHCQTLRIAVMTVAPRSQAVISSALTALTAARVTTSAPQRAVSDRQHGSVPCVLILLPGWPQRAAQSILRASQPSLVH